MDDRQPRLGGRARDVARAGLVDREGALGLALGLVDGGVGRRVDHRVRAHPRDRRRDGRGVLEVELGAADADDLRPIEVPERPRHLALAPHDQQPRGHRPPPAAPSRSPA